MQQDLQLVKHMLTVETTFLPSLEADLALADRLATLERDLKSRSRWVAGPSTLFEALGLVRHELANCLAIRWIIDPLAPHGLGSSVLTALLRRLGEDTITTDLADDALTEVAVRVEESRRMSRADVVIEGADWSVVIEAKIAAGEQPEQGHRLEQDWPDAQLVFLTTTGRGMETASDEERWHQLRWGDLWSMIAEALETTDCPSAPGAASARAAVRDYLTAVGHVEEP